MEIRFKDVAPESLKTDLLVVPVSEKRVEETSIRALDRRLKGKLQERIHKSRFIGAEGTSLLYSTAGVLPAPHLLLIGLGKAADIDAEIWRRAGARARREAGPLGVEEIGFFFSPERDPAGAAAAIVEGTLLASYQFTKYRSNAKNPLAVKALTLHKSGLTRSSGMDQAVRTAEETVGAVFLARDLINEPPSVTTARYLGEQAERH
jgi:leucyl aminopeptidase